MPLTVRAESSSSHRFAAWAIGPWVLLLVAALGGVQYLTHADYIYLSAALMVIAVSAGCILRQGWARMAMRWMAVLLALWASISGGLMLQHWGDFEHARQQALAQPQLGEVVVWMIDRAQRTWQIGLALKGLVIPLLLWLAWMLGKPSVRAQFRQRR